MSQIAIFSGSSHPELAAAICAELSVPLLPTRVKRFSNDCIEVQLQANCREQDVFLIQTLSAPVLNFPHAMLRGPIAEALTSGGAAGLLDNHRR